MTEDKQTINKEVKKQVPSKNVFKMNCVFNEQGESLEHIVERAFSNYCSKRI